MKIKKYSGLFIGSLLEQLQYRMVLFITLLGNIIYLIIIYSVWKAIYSSVSDGIIKGMNFEGTMIQLVLASSLFYCTEMYIVWGIGKDVQSGKIILDLIKPMEYLSYLFWRYSGTLVANILITFLPTFIVVRLVTGNTIQFNINIIYFLASFLMGVIINYSINFITGIVCIYTNTIWGINIMKEAVVLLLSGATIPILFFPVQIQKILMFLPFPAIYSMPIKLLIDNNMLLDEIALVFGYQFTWVIIMLVICKIFFKISMTKIVINGG